MIWVSTFKVQFCLLLKIKIIAIDCILHSNCMRHFLLLWNHWNGISLLCCTVMRMCHWGIECLFCQMLLLAWLASLLWWIIYHCITAFLKIHKTVQFKLCWNAACRCIALLFCAECDTGWQNVFEDRKATVADIESCSNMCTSLSTTPVIDCSSVGNWKCWLICMLCNKQLHSSSMKRQTSAHVDHQFMFDVCQRTFLQPVCLIVDMGTAHAFMNNVQSAKGSLSTPGNWS